MPCKRPAFSSPFHWVSLRGLTFIVALAGMTGGSAARAADDSPDQSGGLVRTSWAASVRDALAHRAHEAATWTQHGMASWYGRHFHGRRTSSGATFDTNALTAAHPSLPLGTKLLVTSQDTGRSVVVTVNDRGPFNSRIIDLSHAAAAKIGMLNSGTAHVTIARMEDVPAETEVAEADPSDTTAQAVQVAASPQATAHTRRHRRRS
ncbi:septal ring lytic transglycosylase RlpA family protein [Gluconobacter morbifer]|uniref:Endolytic peptidoglycan transglycosylase RlpA n=1 Tax=Gluconobacter morbifer G707 TaxID=1088869 RepID=G6XLS6_9PROT|nr:rare lipoprotein A [Gluconobacter morbifer G707]